MRRDISGARDNSVLRDISGRAKFLYIYFMFQPFRSHEAKATRGCEIYLCLEGRDSSRCKVVSVHVNGSHRDISVVRDNFVSRAHAFLSKRDKTAVT